MANKKGGQSPHQTVGGVAVYQHEGPLPAVQDLVGYNQLVPGAAERIIAMAERQQQHVIESQRKQLELQHEELEVQRDQQQQNREVIRASEKITKRNQWFAFLVVLVAFAFAGYLVHMGQTIGGIALFVGEISALLALFLRGDKGNRPKK